MGVIPVWKSAFPAVADEAHSIAAMTIQMYPLVEFTPIVFIAVPFC
ncbi:MAG: hypothetical protein JW743_08070 [Deltaproteobacteria bacterium]|nr:hypothetical protein [Deltaproteobacteria bacterium]MBN2845373.1 hypothetical protein [Deltaproteobacteria bacterium]